MSPEPRRWTSAAFSLSLSLSLIRPLSLSHCFSLLRGKKRRRLKRQPEKLPLTFAGWKFVDNLRKTLDFRKVAKELERAVKFKVFASRYYFHVKMLSYVIAKLFCVNTYNFEKSCCNERSCRINNERIFSFLNSYC